MPHIFRFHKGRNNNIYNWKASDKITPADVREVADNTNILSSSAGTSIPTPLGRMFLFKTAFEIVAAQIRDNNMEPQSIYAGLVSEALDLLELLYKCGADPNKFDYETWIFDTSSQDDEEIGRFFGNQHGHQLLAQSFRQTADQQPFDKKIEMTLIYYFENGQKVLLGGTSPFTFVFTSPNFKRKMREKEMKSTPGMMAGDFLFDSDYKQLNERDDSFIKYIESLSNEEGIGESFSGFVEYVNNTRYRFHKKFNGTIASLKEIYSGSHPLSVNHIRLKQISEEDYRNKINIYSDFKIELPENTSYTDPLRPLFLLDKMQHKGQYTSPSSHWSNQTRVGENEYPETTIDEIKSRELPGLDSITYPFLSAFDFFERCIIKLPGYALNNERFLTLTDNQTFLLPIKPIFFHLFPASNISAYVSVEIGKNREGKEIYTFTIKIPVYGATVKRRIFDIKKTYEPDTFINYSGILGIFPLTKTTQNSLAFINKYTVASYEKTIAATLIENIKFFKKSALNDIDGRGIQRSNYEEINTKSTYYQLTESFDFIQLNFRQDNSNCGGVIIPKFKEVENGTESYVFAIDFGTSNTHIEYGRVLDEKVTETLPFNIDEKSMQITLLNMPKEVVFHDGSQHYRDYESSMGQTIDAAWQVALREFVPIQIGTQKSAPVKFPFRTATCESQNFISNQKNNRLFVDANIGFNIDEDATVDYVRYKTDLKWLLERGLNDQFHINRVSIFFRQLLLMIRTKVLLEENKFKGDINKIQIAMSLPISMGASLKSLLIRLMDVQKNDILGNNSLPLKDVTESIAPYYQLKYISPNIQNDATCNIDIGGGTTDIVLIDRNLDNPNELNCYCSSFKFAGRQLWSSGSNEFNTNENGFVAYYKNFIEKTDPAVFKKLKKILDSRSQKTEDLVGLLFSRPEYRFTDIFSELKELKAVLVIHYSAILYFIVQVAKLKEVDLPRTISFSGKGSEYLSILFSNTALLKAFTQKVLGIFAGKPIRNDFQVEKSNEPKVITAKGSAHFAVEKINQDNNDWGVNKPIDEKEKRLVLVETIYKGFKDFSLEDKAATYSSLFKNNELSADIFRNFSDFFSLLFDNRELCTLINKYLEFKDFAVYKSFFVKEGTDITREGKLRDSFKSTLANLNLTDNITDSPFFFALNYSLIELSKEIATQHNN